jgi:hypothetical protein
MKPTPTDIADAIAKCEAGPDPVSGEYEFPDYRDAGSHWFCVLYDPEGKRVCDGFDDTTGAAMAMAWVGAHAPRWDHQSARRARHGAVQRPRRLALRTHAAAKICAAMASLTLKNIGAGNAPAGTTAAVGSEVRVVGVVELVRREIRRLTNDELHQVRLEIETLLGHV